MTFFRKIYINNKPLILTNSAEQYCRDHPGAASYLLLTGAATHNFRLASQHLFETELPGAVIEDISTEALLKELQDTFELIEAAGGVVRNPEGAILMIYRRGKWDLPKGKRDDGETIEECALREVKEETGLPELQLEGKVCETYHAYRQDEHELLKTTHWYNMRVEKAFELYPQEEEDIIEARWVTEKELGLYADLTYNAIKEVLVASGKVR